MAGDHEVKRIVGQADNKLLLKAYSSAESFYSFVLLMHLWVGGRPTVWSTSIWIDYFIADANLDGHDLIVDFHKTLYHEQHQIA